MLAALVAFGACTSPPIDSTLVSRDSRRAALHDAHSFAVVLSERAETDELAAFDVAILDPDAYESADLVDFQALGVTTLAYVNIGEVEDWRSHAASVDPAWVLGENSAWPGHRFVDARADGWQRLVVDRIAKLAVAKQFDGLFLDMADVASPGLFPETEDGIVALVEALRAAYPEHAIVMNRGLFLLDRVLPAIDGLLVEGVWARLDLESGTYVHTPGPETDLLLAALHRVRDEGAGAFAVDYADTDRLRTHVLAEARRARLPVYVGTRALGSVPAPLGRPGW